MAARFLARHSSSLAPKALVRLFWSLFINVKFAVVQIILIVVAGLIGTLVRQIPSYALYNPAAYQRELLDLHRRYDGVSFLGWQLGPSMVELFDRLGFFRIFSASWFLALATILAISLAAYTLDRLPRLWREVRDVRVVQPAAYFHARLANRAVIGGVASDAGGRGGEGVLSAEAVLKVLRRRHYRVREVERGDRHYFYGDRNRYSKLATLLTHAGLVVFLVAGVITGTFGYETVVFVADGQSAPVQSVGTLGNLVVRNVGFYAPRNPDGSFADFYSDIVVYRDGLEIASKRIRVNDPLEVDGFRFHQNTFGPAADMEIRDASGALLWSGPVIMDQQTLGKPSATMVVPGSNTGLLIVLDRKADGQYGLAFVGFDGLGTTAQANVQFALELPPGTTSVPGLTGGYQIRWTGVSGFTGMVIKKDPGQPLVLVAFAALISGLFVSFYLPRRRVWSVLADGRLRLAVRGDRYANDEGELAELVAALHSRLPTPAVAHPETAPAVPGETA